MDSNNNDNTAQNLALNELTEKIIGCAYKVANSLGSGFLEKVYENALVLELQAAGIKVVQQKLIKIYYRNILIGEYAADLLIEDRALVELKAVQALDDVFFAQCLNYLRATGLEVCLLLNFGKPELQIKRISPRKEWLQS
jgi:GxxExxY protein